MSSACLILHGFGGSPFEVEPLKKTVESMGIYAITPTLPGHATSFADFITTSFPDWLKAAEQHLEQLFSTHSHVMVMGFSMGGTLALSLAERYPVSGLVAIASPTWLYRLCPREGKSLKLVFLPVLQYIRPVRPFKIRTAESRAIAPSQGYEGKLYLPHLYSMHQAYKTIRANLKHITCPTLLIHDIKDTTVPASSSLYVAQRVVSQEIHLHYTAIQEKITSHHMLTTHRETKDFVMERIAEFSAARLAEIKTEIRA